MKTFEVRNIVAKGKVEVSLVLSSTHIHALHAVPLEDSKPLDELGVGEGGNYYINAGKGSWKGEYLVVRTV